MEKKLGAARREKKIEIVRQKTWYLNVPDQETHLGVRECAKWNGN
jgi:hypothetical protein